MTVQRRTWWTLGVLLRQVAPSVVPVIGERSERAALVLSDGRPTGATKSLCNLPRRDEL